ncbi:alanine--tRNA ligase-related protein [Vibrio natriegens]|uniref:Alanyl-tRNA editing protein n=1 Tax=Vibrio natriegens NBRC 15636 = ATCC 14048 = DSM 759 TaxID=1219067 RepID=A0AAN0Y2D9_VIBNA|nr:alanyl-tRNA editing protein [Vibrio natriegens]ALR15349.1 alanyl-tRNA synthetase [Vibrio natriegens NBRC 15636 = ATCC 14048 = DSM 759]ANQ12792.1 alanyl-tRNA editing protein [Vibrio natriegens NBRC 15636 = ATCC 14048 = DSM 759]EPM38401.1 alanyl-tRNA synthetase [Vibrio natriegens NBRC 15636 = ATCC 14048 = DSM 759]MDX6027193.1 alanyl-tRNA editing protein [Vibrio natriegens NBRC 15636 = ATCC 14048 = DSM 759]UUI10518.1 alanyl-tRNA editing protein [Vibrio natriegens]
MTEKVFWNNPYQPEIISVVTQITGNNVELSHTIFYAESGGQESDEGTIAGIRVVKAEKSGSRIIYTLETTPTFAVGDEVVTEIDWPRRYALMKLHFAAEVVLELFTQNFNSITKIGAHISEDKSRIDFEWPENIAPLLPALQYKAQALIDSDSIITSEFSDQTKERRYWKVEGFAQVPCGGTHLKRTSEVGKIALKRKNVGKGKERVEITLVREDT